jgi:prenyltransferase beta subunit
MLRAARAGTELPNLEPGKVRDFLLAHRDQAGGFLDRAGMPDLYYTVFGAEGLLALSALRESHQQDLREYLKTFGIGQELDLVELGCLARCWADVGGLDESTRNGLLDRLEDFHCVDGGYSQTPGYDQAGVYGCFLAAGIQEDLTGQILTGREITKFLEASRTSQGAYSADTLGLAGTVPTTAAAVVVLERLGAEPDPRCAQWLIEQCIQGAFHAVDGAPVGDLLSTAVALHALNVLQVSLDEIRGECLTFIQSLQTPEGGFCGTTLDPQPDCEYTFYALLAMGHLAGEG